jgi:phosphate-selective porin OprO and OprP
MNSKALTLTIILLALAASVVAQDAANIDAPSAAAPGDPPVTKATLSNENSAAVEPAVTATRQAKAISLHRDGLWFSTADGGTHLQVHGYVQADDRMFLANTHGEPVDAFLFRKMRPLFEGTLFNNIDFRFMPDFGQNNPQIQEAFLELKTLPFAKVRVGKFKVPIGLEVLRQDRDLSFVERSMASDLLPLRYIGAQISGSVLSNSITYEGGYFNGSSDGSNGVFTQWARGNEAAARAFFHPFAITGIDTISHFGIGVAGSAGDQHGTIAGLKTIGQATFFKYSSGALADGQHNRLAPQAYYYAGPLGFMGEYVISSQEVLNKGIAGRIRNEAWQAEGSVLLTGERNGYTGVRARNAFEPGRGFDHFGALELAFRYSQVRIDGDAFAHFANRATSAQFAGETGIAFNWYLTRYVKLQTEYEHTGFRMAPGSTTPLHSENLLLSQVQLAF